jgi:nitrogen fixation/metabolism regulation signal transduction histidine kinase
VALTVRTLFFQVFPVVITALLLATSLILLGISTSNPQQTSDINAWLFPLNIIILLILSSLIIYNVFKAIKYLRSGQAGSRFTIRLMYAFALLTILPVLVVSYFSMNFIGDRIDNWFNIKIEGALDDSLELVRSSLDVRMRQHLFDLERASKALAVVDELDYTDFIERQAQAMGAYEIVLLNSNKRVLVYSGEDAGTLLPHFPADEIYRKIASRGYMYQLEPADKDGLFSRVALKLTSGLGRETLILTALFPFSDKEQILAESVQDTFNQYQEINYQRGLIKKGFRITLLLIMLLSILFSIWAALIYSLRLTKPIRTLLEGTMSVASGNLQTKLPVAEKDDFSLLARSFNTMTTRLSTARRESEQSQNQLKHQHDYLNIVLDNMTSGVITLDDDFVIRRINSAAEQLLLAAPKTFRGKTLEAVCTEKSGLLPFYENVKPYLLNEDAIEYTTINKQDKVWQTDISLVLEGVQRNLVCRGVALPELTDETQGYVLVFNDISEALQAEHDAAWSEVARRLAHEIKNPLTPIQLSAERLQRRLKPILDEESADLLDRMSSTIINQVDTMKKMVDAFSEYAKIPELKLRDVDINSLITEVSELYRINLSQAQIKLDLESSPILQVDTDRIRQLLINLIKNALEATDGEGGGTQPIITISSQVRELDNGYKQFVLTVSDNGPGIDEVLLTNIFEPYKTSKVKGSGLGLAIVKRIVEEHGGRVIAKNNKSGGARINVYLPIN